MIPIAISRIHFPVTTLGPGRRVGIWMQGCSIRCTGCISADTWAEGRGATSVAEVLRAIEPWLVKSDGITISGGEPFDQPDALAALLASVRERSEKSMLVYSGHPIEILEDRLNRMSELIDALISDPYLVDETQTLALRGSDNQRLHFLTPRGRASFLSYERPLVPSDQRFDLMMDETGEVWMAGIPGRNDFHRLASLLASQKHEISTTQDRSVQTARREKP